jgi:hypothetical protein
VVSGVRKTGGVLTCAVREPLIRVAVAKTTAQRGRTARRRPKNAGFRVRLEFMEGAALRSLLILMELLCIADQCMQALGTDF